MTSPLRIYIGWDAREPIAYDVAKFSLERRASIPVEITPIKLDDLRARKLYWRDSDPLASTEFTYSRFLTPALAGFRGWALFIDCDFLWLGDIAGLADYMRVPKAVYCVQHDYRPKETVKMDGAVQTSYPRKNWSSFMLFNCDHPSVRRLTPEVTPRAAHICIACNGPPTTISARCRWNGTGSRAGTKSLRTARRARCIHPRRPLV
jgi:hypothetical protein